MLKEQNVFICDDNYLFMNYLNNKIAKWISNSSKLIDNSDMLKKHIEKNTPSIVFINERMINDVGMSFLKLNMPNSKIIVMLENASLAEGNVYLSEGATDIMTKASVNSIISDRFFEQKMESAWVA